MKGDMQRAALAPMSASGGSLDRFLARGGRDAASAGFGYAGNGRPAAGPPASAAQPALAEAGADMAFGAQIAGEARAAEKNVRNLGNRTFYRRDGLWVDSQATKDQQHGARRIKQFSDEYFDLARRYGRTMSQYLALDEPVLLILDRQAYLIEP
jgi:hypothetical protein